MFIFFSKNRKLYFKPHFFTFLVSQSFTLTDFMRGGTLHWGLPVWSKPWVNHIYQRASFKKNGKISFLATIFHIFESNFFLWLPISGINSNLECYVPRSNIYKHIPFFLKRWFCYKFELSQSFDWHRRSFQLDPQRRNYYICES